MMSDTHPSPDQTRKHDWIALAALFAIVLSAVGFRWYYDNWVSDFDMFTQYFPWFGYIGDRLADFEIPAWNPHDALGEPISGFSSGGWMYLPVMLIFPFFGVITAMKLMILVQMLIGTITIYWFARQLGFMTIAAFGTGVTYAVGPVMYGSTGFGTLIGQLTPWLIVSMLATENTIRASRLSSRLGWAALGGVAISQLVIVWPGQGVVYSLMYIAGWLAYRWLVAPLPEIGSRAMHFRRAVECGMLMGITAATFGAAGILPRLDFSSQSHIPGGDYANVIGGGYASYTWPWVVIAKIYMQHEDMTQRALSQSATVLILAVIAILFGRGKYGIPFFAVAVVLCFDLAARTSFTRHIFYLIPGFEHLHAHRPTLTPSMTPLAVALLAGAGLKVLLIKTQTSIKHVEGLMVPLVAYLVIVYTSERDVYPIGWWPVSIALIATAFVLLSFVPVPGRWSNIQRNLPTISIVSIIVLILAYPTLVDFTRTIRDPEASPEWTNPIARDPFVTNTIDKVLRKQDPGTAAEFLQQQQALQQPFRYAPFTGTADSGTIPTSAAARRMDPDIVAILANGRATRLGLEQVSGYNPLHLKYYAEFIDVMNRKQQDYHFFDVMTAGLSSPLLDMLNVRYVTVPNSLTPLPPAIASSWTMVFQDPQATVYENPEAYGRAWIVHDVRDNQETGFGLRMLASGNVDGRQVAYVNGEIPPVSAPDPAGPVDSAVVTGDEPESITISAKSTGDGLLVVSEAYAKGWNAYVDGEKVDVLRTNHALRGVPITAGEHTVVLKYEPFPLKIGLWSTGISSIAIIGIWGWALVDRRRRR